MKRSFSLRSQLFGLMALLVFLQSIALVVALVISRVFLMLDAEAFRLFANTTATRAQTYNESVVSLVQSLAGETKALSAEIQAYAQAADMDEAALYQSDSAYLEVTAIGTHTLISLLQNNEISGAFIMLDGSNANKASQTAHSAVYFRNAATSSTHGGTDNYVMEIGPISVSQQNKISTSINWRLDLEPKENGAYFHNVIEAVKNDPGAEIERYGYWSPPVNILDDGQQVISYTMPLIGRDGSAFGVVGIEISLTLINQRYLPSTDLAYQSSFYGISSVQDDTVHLEWYIPGGPIAQVYLKQGEDLSLKPVDTTSLYATDIAGLGEMYCAIEPLTMYSRNSPFYAEQWSLVGYVPQAVLHETSSSIRTTLLTSIAVTTAVSFLAVFVILFVTTRKISGLSKYVKTLSPSADIRFTRTGIREIDELMTAVENLNQRVISASKTTSKILELTLMPIGGYEINEETGYVVLTEFIYKLLNISPGTEVTREAWETLYGALVKTPAKGYEDIYQFTDHEGSDKWLRILQAPTETGRVGIVLDVTQDIVEHRRLAHELDYDALTHLYSRTAFKREAVHLIRQRPELMGAMIFIDLDNLKYMNDTYGHDMGDRLIIRAGEMFRMFEHIGGVVSRISGDEFAIYLHGYEDQESIRNVIRQFFGNHAEYTLHTTDGQAQRIRFSAGIAFYPEDSRDVTDLLKLSDYAMYEAKHSEKGTVVEFNQESYRENLYLLENREAINLLLDEGLIRFAFQPIVDIRTGEVYAYEALMRPLLDNFKSPLEILSVAAAQSKLGQLERLVLLMAFEALRERTEVLAGRMLFINSIPSQSLTEEDMLTLEHKYDDLFTQVVIEITEADSAIPEVLQRKLDFIRKHHMKVAVDDFGSGYSNEIRILSMTPDIIKVDIELISNIDTNPDKQKLLMNLISFCQPKGVRIVAEGVERREELAQLIRMGVDYVQGYYLARPAFEMLQIPEEAKQEILSLQGLREE